MAVSLGVNPEFAVTDFRVDSGVEIPGWKADRALSGLEIAWINNSDLTGITGDAAY